MRLRRTLSLFTDPWSTLIYFVCLGSLLLESGRLYAHKRSVDDFLLRANFTYEGNCANQPIQFQDRSKASGQAIVKWQWDFGDEQAITAEASLQHPIHHYHRAGSYEVSLQVFTQSGKTHRITHKVHIRPSPAPPKVWDDHVCEGKRAQMEAHPKKPAQIEWYPFHDTLKMIAEGTQYQSPPLSESRLYRIRSRYESGCVSTWVLAKASVSAISKAKLLIESAADKSGKVRYTFSVQSEDSLQRWDWDFGDGHYSKQAQAQHTYLKAGKYEVGVWVEDRFGCRARLSQSLEAIEAAAVSIPSAFSPNGDGVNDHFRIRHQGLGSCKVRIFNQWGQLVFETNQANFTWDGTGLQGQRLREGIYVLRLSGHDQHGQEVSFHQSVTLIR